MFKAKDRTRVNLTTHAQHLTEHLARLTCDYDRLLRQAKLTAAAIERIGAWCGDTRPVYICYRCALVCDTPRCPVCGLGTVGRQDGGRAARRAYAAEWLTLTLASEPDCALEADRVKVRSWSTSIPWGLLSEMAIRLDFIAGEVWRLPDDHPLR